jgi:hypothetical protein
LGRMPAILTPEEAADLADVKPAQLKIWLGTGVFKPKTQVTSMGILGDDIVYYFDEQDVERLVQFAAGQRKQKPVKGVQFVDDGTLSQFTVAQIASMWQLSTDTIQRMFEEEPGVIPLGNKNPRGKRKRITLRIPREVMERVKKRKANP